MLRIKSANFPLHNEGEEGNAKNEEKMKGKRTRQKSRNETTVSLSVDHILPSTRFCR